MFQLRRSRLPIAGLVLAGLLLWILRAVELVDAGFVPGWLPVAVGQLVFTLCYGLLFRAFAASLRPGQDPLISIIARGMRGTLVPEIERYTRAVTMLWTVLFATLLIVSFALLVVAPVPLWSSFVTWISLALVGLTLAAEFVVRRIRLRHHPRDRLRDLGKVLRMTMAAATK
jgi:uncharacterized membrane protein